MGFLGAQDKLPAFCWFKSLRLERYDERNRICVMAVNDMTTAGINKPPARDQHVNAQCAQELLTWSENNLELVQQLQARIHNL